MRWPKYWSFSFNPSLLSGVLGTGLPGLGTEHLPGAVEEEEEEETEEAAKGTEAELEAGDNSEH